MVAHGFDSYSEALHAVTRVHRHAREVIEARGYMITGVADEGGWGPLLPSNETALQIVTEAIEGAGYRPPNTSRLRLTSPLLTFTQMACTHCAPKDEHSPAAR